MKTLVNMDSQSSQVATGVAPASPKEVLTQAPAAMSDPPAPPEARATPKEGALSQPQPSVATPPRHRHRKWLLWVGIVAALGVGGYFLVPWIDTTLNTVSTDDAYVNGHVTFVAPRVSGQVMKVLVDDNQRVKKGDVLVQLDKEPYQVQVAIKMAAVVSAEADLIAANALVRAQVSQAWANRFKLQHAMEDVNTQIANLSAAVATLNSKKASLDLAEANLRRGKALTPSGAMSKEDFDIRRQTAEVDKAAVDQALQQVYAIRVGLGLTAQPARGDNLTEVPPNLDQNFSTVREALGALFQSGAQFGLFPPSWDVTPKKALEDFYKRDPDGDLDRIVARIIPQAPSIKQAEGRLLQARRDLEHAELNLRYCDIVSEIDGVVTSRNVNPGNDVQAGQQLLAVRSLTEIWIDANFKETQLADLRIGQRVRCEVDMYGSRKEFEGRITGFTMGTGQTLALLPPQNATGNFVKIVQRLPVRVELTDYDPNKAALFVGLSVTPYVYYKEPPTGPHAGEVLQPLATVPAAPIAK
jgi:membrane fusion protein (multidrug efflux system)